MNNIEEILTRYKVSDSGCWEWTAYINPRGYGRVRYKGVSKSVHRLSYFHTFGIGDESLFVCHKCDNRAASIRIIYF